MLTFWELDAQHETTIAGQPNEQILKPTNNWLHENVSMVQRMQSCLKFIAAERAAFDWNQQLVFYRQNENLKYT